MNAASSCLMNNFKQTQPKCRHSLLFHVLHCSESGHERGNRCSLRHLLCAIHLLIEHSGVYFHVNIHVQYCGAHSIGWQTHQYTEFGSKESFSAQSQGVVNTLERWKTTLQLESVRQNIPKSANILKQNEPDQHQYHQKGG